MPNQKEVRSLDCRLGFTGGELLYLAALLGATEFTGVDDVFYGMDDQEITQEITALESRLVEKGYGLSGFNGGFTISVDVIKAISVCIDSQVEVIFDRNEMDINQSQDIYHVKNGISIWLKKKSSTYMLSTLDRPEDIVNHIIENIQWRPQGSQHVSDMIKLNEEELSLLKDLAEGFDQSAGFAALAERGLSKTSALAILDSFKDSVNYYSIMLSTRMGEDSDAAGIVLVDTGKDLVEFVPAIVDDSEVLLAKLQTVEGAKASITKMILDNITKGVETG